MRTCQLQMKPDDIVEVNEFQFVWLRAVWYFEVISLSLSYEHQIIAGKPYSVLTG